MNQARTEIDEERFEELSDEELVEVSGGMAATHLGGIGGIKDILLPGN